MVKLLRIIALVSLVVFPFASRAQLSANFTIVGSSSGCVSSSSSLPVHFSDMSTGSPVRWHWVFDSLSPLDTGYGQTPTYVYGTAGHYNVKLTVYNAAGDSSSYTMFNAVYAAAEPIVRFTASDTIHACPPKTITFTNTSDTGGCSPYYTWYIDTSTSIHTKDATYTFTRPGVYDIKLTESDGCSCSGQATKYGYIKIDTAPVTCFYASDSALCSPPVAACFSNCTSDGLSYRWHFGDGSFDTAFSPCHTYSALGTYTDTLVAIAANGCTDTLVKPAYVQVSGFYPGFYVSPGLPACINTAITLHDTTSGAASHFWRFSNAATDVSSVATPSHTYNTLGTYVIKDSVWNGAGCHGFATDTVIVKPRPVVTFSVTNAYRCSPNDTVSFTSTVSDAAGIAAKVWHFGDPTSGGYNTAYSDSIHVYADTGAFTPIVIVADNNGCVTRDSIIKAITIRPAKGYLFVSRDSGCVPVTFTYSTSDTPVVTYFTDSVTFGDGTTATIGSGSHTYSVAGVYTIHHYFHLPAGCSYSDSIKFYAGSHATYAMTNSVDSVCQKTRVTFAGHCTTCTSERWSASGGLYPTDSIFVTYNASGTKYLVYYPDNAGCIDTVKDSVYVYSPSANFTPSVTSCSNHLSYNFINTSVGATNYYWSFGDGATSTLATPGHSYAGNGNYIVSLIDSEAGSHGCVITAVDTLVIDSLTATFTANNTITCKSKLITFSGPLTDSSRLYAGYKWYFGDSTSYPLDSFRTVSSTATHAYTATGTYSPWLVIQNANGCYDTIHQSNYIRIVVPSGGVTPGPNITSCKNLAVNFIDNDTDYTGAAITNRHWIWNTGNPPVAIASPSTTHIYTAVGTYRTVMIDSDSKGCFVKDTINVTIVQPAAYFTSADTVACTNVAVTFTDTNSYASYTWSFGDTGDTTTNNPVVTHVYTANGYYTDSVSIRIDSSGGPFPVGCQASYSRTNYIHVSESVLHPQFAISDTFSICPPLYVQPVAASDGTYHLWRFGTGYNTSFSLSDVSDTLYDYAYPGVYRVTLVDSNLLGCKDSTIKTVTVLGPTGYVTSSADSGCAGFISTFHVTDTGSEEFDTSYTWRLGPSSFLSTDTPGIVTPFTDTAKFKPYVIVSNQGCRVNIYLPDSIRVFPPVLRVTQPPLNCTYTAVPLHITGLTGGYTWSPSYGLSCTTCDSTIASPTLTTTYTVSGTNTYGCPDTTTTIVAKDIPPIINRAWHDHICKGLPDTLVTSGIAGPYSWFPADSVSCASCAAVVTVPLVSQLYTFTALDTNGCADTATFAVIVDSLPVVQVTPSDTTICIASTATITATGASAYNWEPAAGLSCDTCASVTSSALVTTTYTVVGTDNNGCKDTVTDQLTVDQLPLTGTISGLTAVCEGATHLFIDTVAGGTWSSSNAAIATISAAGNLTALHPGTDTIKYSFGNTCGIAYAATVVEIDSNPVAIITTHPGATVCSQTLYQNYGTDLAAPPGTTYQWSVDGCALYAVGTGSQYCLVSFPSSGEGIVKLTASFTATGCTSADVYNVNVESAVSPHPYVAYYAPNELVCEDNTADSYQWGYDDVTTLDSTLLAGELNQDCFIAAPDFTHKYYWVITDHSGCLQKTYYTTPTATQNITRPGAELTLFPNPAGSKINIEVSGVAKAAAIDIRLYDMGGNNICKDILTGSNGSIDLTNLADGVYMVIASEHGKILGSKTFVKN
jgi:PKD repeat protein